MRSEPVVDKYPEHSKLNRSRDRLQTLIEFIEWLQSHQATPQGQPLQLGWRPKMEYDVNDLKEARALNAFVSRSSVSRIASGRATLTDPDDQSVRTQVYISDEFVPYQFSVEGLMARFFGIDLQKLEAEDRQMLGGDAGAA